MDSLHNALQAIKPNISLVLINLLVRGVQLTFVRGKYLKFNCILNHTIDCNRHGTVNGVIL